MDAKLREAVLDMIGNIQEQSQPWCSEYALNEIDEVPRDLDGDADLELLEKCLSQLEDEGLIESRWSPQGWTEYALVEALKHPDYVREQEFYSSLKETVLTEARRQGFICRWDPEHSWQLRRSDGIAYSGPIRVLAQHLGIQVSD